MGRKDIFRGLAIGLFVGGIITENVCGKFSWQSVVCLLAGSGFALASTGQTRADKEADLKRWRAEAKKRLWDIAVEVQVLPIDELHWQAIASFNAAFPNSPVQQDEDPARLESITVHFIRHELTTYDADLQLWTFASSGGENGPAILQQMVSEAIARAYPFLDCWMDLMFPKLGGPATTTGETHVPIMRVP